MKKVKTIKNLSEISELYDYFLLDQWGVMHDGNYGYSYAIECVKSLIKLKKKLFIISNSSKRKKETAERLFSLGFNKSDFADIQTSGEMIWQSLNSKLHLETKKLGRKCFHIFDEKIKENKFLEGLNFDITKNIDEADFILGTTISPNSNTIDFVDILKKAIVNNLPFICANPDFETVQSTDKKKIICMGTIAELYKDFGGKVFILGKPKSDIYLEVTKNIKKLDKTKILAIGDSIYHDIMGANIFGIDNLLITSGIHKSSFNNLNPQWNDKLNSLYSTNILPKYICAKFEF